MVATLEFMSSTNAESTNAQATSIPPTNSRVAVVTGASAGIGEATARLLAADGWHVVLAARRAEKLEQVAQTIAQEGG